MANLGVSPAQNPVFRERAPSSGSRAALIVLGLVGLACLVTGIIGHWPPEIRGAFIASALVLYAVNFAIKKNLGFDVEVTADGIREVKSGGVNIRWAERPEITFTNIAPMRGATPKAAATAALVNVANIQSVVVRSKDGRTIRLDTVFGSPIHAAVQRYSIRT